VCVALFLIKGLLFGRIFRLETTMDWLLNQPIIGESFEVIIKTYKNVICQNTPLAFDACKPIALCN